jgi:hypothetical protein
MGLDEGFELVNRGGKQRFVFGFRRVFVVGDCVRIGRFAEIAGVVFIEAVYSIECAESDRRTIPRESEYERIDRVQSEQYS